MVRRKDKKVLSTYKRYRKSRGWLGSLRYGPLTIWSTKVDSCPKRSISEALNSKSQVIQTFIKKSLRVFLMKFNSVFESALSVAAAFPRYFVLHFRVIQSIRKENKG